MLKILELNSNSENKFYGRSFRIVEENDDLFLECIVDNQCRIPISSKTLISMIKETRISHGITESRFYILIDSETREIIPVTSSSSKLKTALNNTAVQVKDLNKGDLLYEFKPSSFYTILMTHFEKVYFGGYAGSEQGIPFVYLILKNGDFFIKRRVLLSSLNRKIIKRSFGLSEEQVDAILEQEEA